MHIDDSELRTLIQRLDGVPRAALKAAEAAAKRGVQNIKNDLVNEARGSKHFRQVANSISYDERSTLRGVEYELGPDKERVVSRVSSRTAPAVRRVPLKKAEGTAGNLAHIAYFGGANGGGNSLDFDGPIQREMPRLEKHLGDALRDAVRDAL